MKLNVSISKRIESLKNERNMSWEKLAYSAGLAKTTMSYIKHCKGDMKLSTLCKIAMAFDITPSELLNFDIDLSELE